MRNDWIRDEVAALLDLPFLDLIRQAAEVHATYHVANEIELATLLSIKTGGCAEDCGYCAQSARHKADLEATKLLNVDAVVAAAMDAKAAGSRRFCMGAAWKSPKERDMPALLDMVARVKATGLETCMTLGMLDDDQTRRFAEAGLDYYNHNLDSSPEYYPNVISTRSYQDRLDTLARVRAAGIATCCGGILGMGESRTDRVGLLHSLATLPTHPASVPINALVPIPGTALGDLLTENPSFRIDDIEFVRTVAAARILMPRSTIRLSAGRETMPPSTQALCFLAGANSIFTGDKLLTADNSGHDKDMALFAALGLRPAAQLSAKSMRAST